MEKPKLTEAEKSLRSQIRVLRKILRDQPVGEKKELTEAQQLENLNFWMNFEDTHNGDTNWGQMS